MNNNPFYCVVHPTTSFINSTGFQAVDDVDAIQKMLDDMKRFNHKYAMLYRLNGTRYPFFVCVINCHLVPGTADVFNDNVTGKVVQFHQM